MGSTSDWDTMSHTAEILEKFREREPINDKLRFEAIGDFYFTGEFAIRAGVMYVLRRK